MPCQLENLGRVFPKKSVLLKTYMLGCFYLFYQTINPDEKRKEKLRISELRPIILRNQSQRNLFQINYRSEKQMEIKKYQQMSYGLIEFRTSLLPAEDQQQSNSTSQVHILQIHSKKLQNFCLDDLSTIESESIPDVKFELQTHSPVDMTQSCMF
ncbi:unnamed protein product [Paramecium octaurelia]|uniref:Uncharacterized protein n=1 Tax=Paramecium octaurelia TaxID=43137 RepID=A0A8S1VST1_PAROT|nr:unnamed protein product [Paramecium octaurelia]